MTPLTASAVRVGMHVLLIPDGQPIPEGAVVYGKATEQAVYQTYYEATHFPCGHDRSEQNSYRTQRVTCATCRTCRPGYAQHSERWVLA